MWGSWEGDPIESLKTMIHSLFNLILFQVSNNKLNMIIQVLQDLVSEKQQVLNKTFRILEISHETSVQTLMLRLDTSWTQIAAGQQTKC